MIDRRRFFGEVITVMVVGGQVWRARAQNPGGAPAGPAYEVWKDWRGEAGDGPLALVRAGILAANAYNTQPWFFRVSDTRIEILADTRRNIGAFDPWLRELHFSLGCALDNVIVAAGPHGYKASAVLSPGPLPLLSASREPVLAARVELARGKPAKNEFYEAIPRRHTNRNPFDARRPVPTRVIETLDRLADSAREVKVFLFTDQAVRRKIVDLIADASGKIFSDPDVQRGTQVWVRATLAEQEKRRDGFFSDTSQSRPNTLDAYASLMMTAPLFGLIAVRDRYDRPQTLMAGRLWQRTHLLATARGLAARPANGAVELIDHERRLNQEPRAAALLTKITGDSLWQPTFMFYMGYATAAAPASPRRAIEDVRI